MILLTGGSGQVGVALQHKMQLRGQQFLAPTRNQLSLDQPAQIASYLQEKQLTAIFHLAAETNVDLCETAQDVALIRNFEATKLLAHEAGIRSIPFIFISSSAVLSGDGEFMHDENSNFSPANFYGVTTMLAEQYISNEVSDFLIIRASWMLGRGSQVKKFAEVAHKKILLGEPFSAVYDKFGSLTSATSLADLILDSYDMKINQTLHYGSFTPCSRYEVAKHIKYRLQSKSEIIPVPSSHFTLPAPRGFSEGLGVAKLAEIFSMIPKTWENELDSFLEEL